MQNELIDRNALCIPSNENDYDELVQFADDVMSADVITEQEIVIPYLEKIKAEISAKQDEFIHSNLLSECNVRYGLEIAEIIIDKYIAELKGSE